MPGESIPGTVAGSAAYVPCTAVDEIKGCVKAPSMSEYNLYG